MTEVLIIKFLHLLGFVYWLGGDLGTFYASHYVIKSDLDKSARVTALDIMMGCDQAPRLCMPLILALGVHLAVIMGFMQISSIWLAVTWLVCLVWVGMVLAIHFGHDKQWLAGLQKFDLRFRYILIVLLAGSAVYGLITGRIYQVDWLAVKMLIFVGMMICGLMIRRKLVNFIPAWVKLTTEGATQEVNDIISNSIKACHPYVYLIWAGLLVNAALGLHLINF